MSHAASQATAFFEQIARERRVYAFLDGDSHVALPMPEGRVMPFWSSRSRMLRIQKQDARYRAFTIDELALQAFVDELLPRLEVDGIRVGANWSGSRLTGYDYTPEEIRRNLSHRLEKASRT